MNHRVAPTSCEHDASNWLRSGYSSIMPHSAANAPLLSDMMPNTASDIFLRIAGEWFLSSGIK